jgi:hypothetical protein
MSFKLRATKSYHILEVPGRGWLVKELGEYHRGAASAFKALTGGMADRVAVIIEWEPTTKGGRMAVDAVIKAAQGG